MDTFCISAESDHGAYGQPDCPGIQTERVDLGEPEMELAPDEAIAPWARREGRLCER
jgi:hypothetical protein